MLDKTRKVAASGDGAVRKREPRKVLVCGSRRIECARVAALAKDGTDSLSVDERRIVANPSVGAVVGIGNHENA